MLGGGCVCKGLQNDQGKRHAYPANSAEANGEVSAESVICVACCPKAASDSLQRHKQLDHAPTATPAAGVAVRAKNRHQLTSLAT